MDIQIVSLNQRSSCLIRNPHFSGSFSKYSSIHSLLRFSANPKNNTIEILLSCQTCQKPRYTTRFDKVSLDKIIERVADLPDPQLDPAVKEAFDVAYDNIYAFHYAQKAPPEKVENMKGVRCKRVSRCITSVGLYVPGGTAVLPSTALMLAVPAQIAGCKIVVLATPPGKDGSICMEVLYCAKKAGVTHILKARGAQVEKIFGPGNQYVTAAKMILQGFYCTSLNGEKRKEKL
ncbi:hypothetical protein C5167_040035 [Papaver somniferum]|uniref:Histidinol dehydrogenase n=1 Tax=Papaver somniferum TaxID=3469 RepID=A0A4Y7IDT3_PAPSO|nr:hypothetical protein C5167_040035 [Papaver somniferum]